MYKERKCNVNVNGNSGAARPEVFNAPLLKVTATDPIESLNCNLMSLACFRVPMDLYHMLNFAN